MDSTTRPPDSVREACPENPVLQSYRIFDERLVVMSESPTLAAHIHQFMKCLDGAHGSEATSATVRLAVFNAPRKHVVMCSPELGVAKTVREHPDAWLTFRRIFMHLAVNMGRPHFPMHACCVANGRGEVALISGTSGAGKTSLTAAMLQRGFRFAADDYALLDAEGQLWSLPIGSTVSKRTMDLVPELKRLRKRSCAFRAGAQWEWTLNFGDLFPSVEAFTPLTPTHFFFVTPDFGNNTRLHRCTEEESVWHFQAARIRDRNMSKPLYSASPEIYDMNLHLAQTLSERAQSFRVVNGDLNAAADLIGEAFTQ